MIQPILQQAFDYYQRNKKDLLSRYEGKFLLMRGEKIISTYSTCADAYYAGIGQFPLGTFFVHECIPNEQVVSYFSPNISFA